ncbi:phage Gp37/Gp68 family protein [Vineibacter terrae]|uniref:Phage Gp37/Gp68 family protein n=1 Tax=Vineibacter terrae TaxID=2586908 RepID=A0A5C8PS65_9HYPH|nr:phage Gp37/Gp68 family protein [Vineibacter terrae]TXL78833.1 phage Gp37/Gp68 family protein [Vineibacter terrae]
MARNSKIEWTHHTFNPWWGCVRVSPACKHCYAEAWAHRLALDLWGKASPRRFFSEAHWRQPLNWNEAAKRQGVRPRVFCASMADVFEARNDLNEWRAKLWSLIERTEHLDWLLLTKRPERAAVSVPWRSAWPENVWLGTTAENQKWADRRIPALMRIPARVRFLSCEPLLGELDLRRWLNPCQLDSTAKIDWVIAGGESGTRARPMNPQWVRSLRDQCEREGTPFHFKQWGHWAPIEKKNHRGVETIVFSGNNGEEEILAKVGKHASGRVLDGRTWDGLPAT